MSAARRSPGFTPLLVLINVHPIKNKKYWIPARPIAGLQCFQRLPLWVPSHMGSLGSFSPDIYM